ncbi:MAG TPA: hypothetical protein VJ951_06750 [Bacteroidales bacterium]|nr:hypothetical protein [Bacteroidales bacterium]
MIKRVITQLAMVLLMQSFLYSQEYTFRFDQVFDNREYFSDFGYPQTIFGAGLNTRVLFAVDSINEVAAGFYYFYENGSTLLGVPPKINLYYHYNAEKLELYFGSFGRRDKLSMERRFLNDTLNYFRPNIEGALLSYEGDHGYVRSFADWTGRVTETRRETFLIGAEGKLNLGTIYIQPAVLMYHNARSLDTAAQLPLQDNGIMSATIGFESIMADEGIIDISAGVVSAYNRLRPADLNWGTGFVTNLMIQHNIFGLDAVYYIGEPLHFEYGDPFYRSGNYGRADLFANPFRNSNIDAKLGWSFHFVRGEGMHHSQQILISVSF